MKNSKVNILFPNIFLILAFLIIITPTINYIMPMGGAILIYKNVILFILFLLLLNEGIIKEEIYNIIDILLFNEQKLKLLNIKYLIDLKFIININKLKLFI